jgi:putative ABC transport system permease protein
MKLQLDPARAPVSLIARPYDVDNGRTPNCRSPAPPCVAPGMPPPIWVSEAVVDIYGMRPGQTVELPLAGVRMTAFKVAGVWRDYARQFGAVRSTSTTTSA